jgi:hypothetical protein
MKKIPIFAVMIAFSFLFGSLNVFAQSSIDNYVNLSDEQRTKSKELQDEYKEQKSDLELQLKKLQKDREVAIRDQNVSLVERRRKEIKGTQAQIKNLAKEYGGKYSDILTDEQKSEMNADGDFYAQELAAQQAKMEAAEKKTTAKAKPAAKAASASKKSAPKKKKAVAKPAKPVQNAEPLPAPDKEAEIMVKQ